MEKRNSRRSGLEGMLRSYFKYFGEEVVTACSSFTDADLSRLSRDFMECVELGITSEECTGRSELKMMLNAYELDQMAEDVFSNVMVTRMKEIAVNNTNSKQ